MSRLIPAVAFALGCTTFAVQAQDTTIRTETKTSGGQAQTVTYTGCVQTGTQERTYMLDKVVPKTETTTRDLQTGSTSTSTTYMLIPGERVQVQEHVGQKVEVTGMLVPAGESRTETRTRVEREDGDDTKTRERVETKNSMPQFRVISIKTLNEKC
jgi:hypothetical protein